MVILLSLLASALAVMAVPLVTETRDVYHPNSSHVFITGFSYTGSGCPPDSANYSVSADLQILTLVYSAAFTATTSNVADSSKYCQIILYLHVPEGVQYSLFANYIRGNAVLGRNTTGLLQNYYYFAGQSQTAADQATIRGPFRDNYQVNTLLGIASTVWSPCGTTAALNMVSRVSVYADQGSRGADATGVMSETSDDSNIQYVCGIQYRTCP